MLRPIAPDDPDLPTDVRTMIGSLRVSDPRPRFAARRMRAGDRSLEPLDELDEDLDDDYEAARELQVPARAQVGGLDRWSVQAHVYSSEIAARLSILAGLFGGSGKIAKAGATHEAKRYRVQSTETGRDVQVGVAVRLAVATTEWEVDAELSVPNIAAAAQLNAKVGDAKIGIDVVGYSGPLRRHAARPAPARRHDARRLPRRVHRDPAPRVRSRRPRLPHSHRALLRGSGDRPHPHATRLASATQWPRLILTAARRRPSAR